MGGGPRDALDLADAGCLQLAQAVSRRLFGIQITLPLVLGFQAGPSIRVDRLDIGSLEFAVGRRLGGKQRRVGLANTQFRLLRRISVRTNRRRQPDRFCPDLALNRFVLSRIARASGKPHRKGNHSSGQQFWAQRQQAIRPQPRPQEFAAIICTTHRIRHRRSDHSRYEARQVAAAACNEISRRSVATMDGKFEPQSNNYDE